MATVTQIGPRLGIAPTCAALGLPRATYYRRRRPSRAAPSRRPSPRALSPGERDTVLARLHDPRFVDHAPAEVYATLLEQWLGVESRPVLAGQFQPLELLRQVA